ncbi:hypothetical protein SAMN05192529_10165 [Arachidicoccus rhizosphaerae]|uniref:Uncharacterized protein n=1 Tax=Arachidicoccus rhizosphaerae TaxID=551991 RepID=A0A1H3VG17_9BACT|nr:hypothetical protein SAMN05192529_10165 [Arachidicoccus rhizosphaerae]
MDQSNFTAYKQEDTVGRTHSSLLKVNELQESTISVLHNAIKDKTQ